MMKSKKLFFATVIVVAVVAIVGARVYLTGDGKSLDEEPTVKVTSGRLDIVVSSPGTIRSRNSAIIKSQAEGRNTVIWVIEEGRIVTNGQLLVELDSSELEKNLTDQLIVVGNTEAASAQAKEQLAIAQIDREVAISDAKLTLELAKLDYEKYLKGEYPQALQEAESKIALAREEVERAAEKLNWTRRLSEEGFVTRSDLQADELSLRQKRTSLESAITAMNLLTNYNVRQQRAKLHSQIQQAERAVNRVTRQSNANVAQAESVLAAKEQEAARQQEKKRTLEQHIASCKVYSPTNGMVIYASTMLASRRRWGADPLAAGSTVVKRQELVHIPVEGGLVVEFSIPESDLTKLERGQPATIGIDAMPDIKILGFVSKIGLMPDGHNAWLNPDMNLYNCEISITNAPEQELRAGMNCSVDMLVASYENVISIPLQCVFRTGSESCVFVLEDGNRERRVVKLGQDNGRVVHIVDGLKIGDEVMLAPPLQSGEVISDAGQRDKNPQPSKEKKPHPSSMNLPKPAGGVDVKRP